MFAQRMIDHVLRLDLLIPAQSMVDHVLRLDLLIPAQRMVDHVLRLDLLVPAQRMVDHVLRLSLLIPAQRMVDRVLRLSAHTSPEYGRSCVETRSGHTKDYEIGNCCFSAKHTALRRKSKDWLAWNQDNVSE